MTALLLVCLAADAGASGFQWDIPEASGWLDVPGTLTVQGVPLKVKAVRSKWEAQPLLQHLANRFVEAGLFVSNPSRQPQLLKEVQLTALDPQSLHTYTVIVQPNPDRTTTLYLSEAAPAARRQTPATDLPTFPNAKSTLTSDLEGARSLSYAVDATPEAVDQFYREAFTKAGFTASPDGRYVKGAREVKVSLKPQGAGVRVLLWDRTMGPSDR